ncbi:expressed unknown protein [Seminavis robusta]|uniref:Methyltransferase n=1 Tax=Seminavis robusta TaxID=568900 RepID=A0A9N8F188_9STRA|nr:expressed unknown protein [Seminavis robusta]|eukprot:Sro2749_g336200.1 n/a (277) ;mRNA; f:3079-3909
MPRKPLSFSIKNSESTRRLSLGHVALIVVMGVCYVVNQGGGGYDLTYLVARRTSITTAVTSDAAASCPPLKPLPPIKGRNEIALFLQEMNFTHGIEIGVQRGNFAAHNLGTWTACQNYKLVDLWAQQNLETYKDVANVNNQQHENFYQETQNRLSPWKHKTEYYRMMSVDAAKYTAKQEMQVDFVYVDARHDYCGCKEDIENYWPLIKPGGILAGHDFMHNDEVRPQDWSICSDGSIHPEAVKGAVMEFANKHGLPLHLTYREPKWNSWWMQKPLC